MTEYRITKSKLVWVSYEAIVEADNEQAAIEAAQESNEWELVPDSGREEPVSEEKYYAEMTTPPSLRAFRASRKTFNAKLPEGMAIIEEVSDLELEPNARLVHRYEYCGLVGIIIERAPPGKGNEYVWLWCHPSESIELTLAKAEAELFTWGFGGEDSDMIDGEPEYDATPAERRAYGRPEYN